MAKPKNSREIVETNNITVSSQRRLAKKHRTATKPLKITAVSPKPLAVVDTPPTPTKNIDEVLENTEQATVEIALVDEVGVVEDEESVEEKLDLDSMTKKQLIEVAKQEKVSYKNLTKPELLEALTIVLG